MNPIHPALRATLCAALILVLCGCAHTKKKPDKPIGPKGQEAARVIGRILSPDSWEEPRKDALIKAIVPLEYHGAVSSDKTLIHAKFEIEDGRLHELLAVQKAGNTTFATDVNAEHAFGPESHKTYDSEKGGMPHILTWWKPKKVKHSKNYYWARGAEAQPLIRVWLQAAERENGKRLVYVRIESDQ